MSEENKTSLEFYSKLNKKLKMILNGEMSLEDYQRRVQFKIDLIIDNEESRLNAKGKRLYHRPQKSY